MSTCQFQSPDHCWQATILIRSFSGSLGRSTHSDTAPEPQTFRLISGFSPKLTFTTIVFFGGYFPKKILFLGFSARSAEFFLGFWGIFLGVFRFLKDFEFFLEFFLRFRREAPKNAKNSVFKGFLKGFWIFLEFFFGVFSFFKDFDFFLEFFLGFLDFWKFWIFFGVLPKP